MCLADAGRTEHVCRGVCGEVIEGLAQRHPDLGNVVVEAGRIEHPAIPQHRLLGAKREPAQSSAGGKLRVLGVADGTDLLHQRRRHRHPGPGRRHISAACKNVDQRPAGCRAAAFRARRRCRRNAATDKFCLRHRLCCASALCCGFAPAASGNPMTKRQQQRRFLPRLRSLLINISNTLQVLAIRLATVPATRRSRRQLSQLPVVGGMGSIPSRAGTLAQVIDTVLPQVDRLHLFLHGYTDIPPGVVRPGVIVHRAPLAHPYRTARAASSSASRRSPNPASTAASMTTSSTATATSRDCGPPCSATAAGPS